MSYELSKLRKELIPLLEEILAELTKLREMAENPLLIVDTKGVDCVEISEETVEDEDR